MPTDRRADRPNVIIIGGGFGGLAAARALRGVDANVAVLDRANHHLFQPLLYQVATASLSPASISQPIRAVLRDPGDAIVTLAEVTGIDLAEARVEVEDGAIPFDYLVLAAGVGQTYFGNGGWAEHAPGLKSIADATEIRRRMLLAFESAEHEGDPDAQRALLTFAIVGGGPTGVELAGAIKEIAGRTLPREYKNIDTATARVILIQGGSRLLESFPEKLSRRAAADLGRLGVEVRLESTVTDVSADGVRVGEEFIAANNVFWAAGVRAAPIAETLGVPLDGSGRVIVEPDLHIAGHERVFVVGDLASFTPAGADHALPGVAQVAMQMGQHAGRAIRAELESSGPLPERGTFRYRDKGSMAIIGRNRAVASIGGLQVAGFPAWLLWAGVHIAFLVGFRNRVRVLFNWACSWLLNSHDARLIVGDARMRVRLPKGPGFVAKNRADPDTP
ncbi:MAG: NAD(P)/FAD-dependent oxidoreductase [Planctomycetota bacterium]